VIWLWAALAEATDVQIALPSANADELSELAAEWRSPRGPFAADLTRPGDTLERGQKTPIYAVKARWFPETHRLSVDQNVVLSVWSGDDRLPFRFLPQALGPEAVPAFDVSATVACHLERSGSLVVLVLDEAVEGEIKVTFRYDVIVPEVRADDADYPAVANALDVGAFGYVGDQVNLAYVFPTLTAHQERVRDERPLPSLGEHAWFDPSHWSVEWDLPEGWEVASTGTRSGWERGQGRTRSVHDAAAVREFAAVLGLAMVPFAQNVGPTEVRLWCMPDQVWICERSLPVAADAFAFFGRSFGRWPRRDLDLVVSPGRITLGSEYSELATLSSSLAIEDVDDTLVHEIAHQWWYLEVHNDQQKEPWVDESLATWSAAFEGERRGPKAAQTLIEAWVQGERYADPGSLRVAADLPTSAYDLTTYGNVVYTRGAMFFEALRGPRSDARLLRGLRRWHQLGRRGPVTGDSLRAVLDESVGKRQVARAWRDFMAEGGTTAELAQRLGVPLPP
jgi:hypothetical protein